MTKVPIFWYLEEFNLLNHLPKEQLKILAENLEMFHYRKGEEITIRDEDGFYFIKNGVVKSQTTIKSEFVTNDILTKGTIYGNTGPESSDSKLTAVDSTVVCLISKEDIISLGDKYPALNRVLCTVYENKILKLEQRLKDIVSKDAKQRINEFLINFITTHGSEENGILKAKNILNHADIANLTYTSRQTVSNTLSKLRTEGNLNYDNNWFYLKP